MTKLCVHNNCTCSAVEPERKIITLPDGYNGHTMRFYAKPIAIEVNLVRLQVAEEGKRWMSKLWPKWYLEKYSA